MLGLLQWVGRRLQLEEGHAYRRPPPPALRRHGGDGGADLHAGRTGKLKSKSDLRGRERWGQHREGGGWEQAKGLGGVEDTRLRKNRVVPRARAPRA